MKNILSKLFGSDSVGSTGDRLTNLKELRSTKHASGCVVYNDHIADVLSAKTELFNNPQQNDTSKYRKKVLSISKTVYPSIPLGV